jgi:hypothetical protein
MAGAEARSGAGGAKRRRGRRRLASQRINGGSGGGAPNRVRVLEQRRWRRGDFDELLQGIEVGGGRSGPGGGRSGPSGGQRVKLVGWHGDGAEGRRGGGRTLEDGDAGGGRAGEADGDGGAREKELTRTRRSLSLALGRPYTFLTCQTNNE